jgi:predicted DNA-binding transcriptional regulator AlpA
MAQQKADPTADVILETTDLARRLKARSGSGPSPRTIERWRTTGDGPAFIKIGHRVAYRASAVEQWLDEQTRSHTNEPGKKSQPTSRRKSR